LPSSDWAEPLDDAWAGPAAPDRLLHGQAVDPISIDALADLVAAADAPVLVVGAGLDSPEGWAGATALAERLACPVWQDTFSSRAGFPQDHGLFAGHLPWQRSALRETFAGNDLVLAAGTLAFRLYLYDGGPLVTPGTRVAVVSDDPEDVQRSRCDLAVLASPGDACAQLAARMPQREGIVEAIQRPAAERPPAQGKPLRAVHVLDALATRLPHDGILVEESPSTRPEMLRRIAVRSPLGFVAVANGALGFGLSSAIGLRLALPERPVVALLGDGSTMYTVQALWTAASYGVGVVVIVIANGRYAVMDELAQVHGAPGAWPSFGSLELGTIATGMGCAALRIATYDELVSALDETMPTLRTRKEPLLLDVRVQ
jgi:benzoylformate decarboxylase